jgi:exodeoxyribonuclease VII small subunit
MVPLTLERPVPKPSAEPAPERYEDIVKRLDEVVLKLESGELSLEDSLKAFEEGVGLVRRGEGKLNEAEKRVELLLSEVGDKRQAFDASTPRDAAQPSERKATSRAPAKADDEDVPF